MASVTTRPSATTPAELTARRSPSQLCREIAALLHVREHEVALLRVDGNFLRFVHPKVLANVGIIPLTHSSSIAVRTVTQRKPEVFNHFASVKHATVFESVPLNGGKGDEIRKLMSAPLVQGGEVAGVIQVSRKASSPAPDFSPEHLKALMDAISCVTVTFEDL